MSPRKDKRTYFMVSNGYVNSPKIVKVGGDAGWLDLCAIDYCSTSTTDGLLPINMVPRLSDRQDPLALASRLLAVGRWHELGHDCESCPQPGADEYVIHDYLDHQRSRAEIEQQREVRQSAGQRGGLAKAANAARREGLANVVALASGSPEQTASKSLPVSVSVSVSEEAPSAPRKRVANRATRLPEDWWPDETLQQWVRDNCPNIRDAAADTRQFVRYWVSKSGKDATKTRWDLTFQNWMEKQNRDAAPNNGRGRSAVAAASAPTVASGRLEASAESWGLS